MLHGQNKHSCMFSIRVYVAMHLEVKISKHANCVATHIASQMQYTIN